MTSGESHGKELTVIINKIPSGIKFDIDYINFELARRQSGYGRGKRMQIETDKVEVTSGVRFGKTTGSPVTMKISNKDWDNWLERMSVLPVKKQIAKLTIPRPGHTDYAGLMKYFDDDIRNMLERSSARETAGRVAIGAFSKMVLKDFNVETLSHTISIGKICINKKYSVDEIKSVYNDNCLRCIDKNVEKKMISLIDKIKKEGNSVGGIFEVIIFNLIPGIGSHVQYNTKLDAKLASSIISIQGVKAIEFGIGFRGTVLKGSEYHDQFGYENKKVTRLSNNCGGIEGGISNGEPIVFRAAMKPIPTLVNPLQSIDLNGFAVKKTFVERSDVCVVPAAGVVAESCASTVVLDSVLEEFGYDNISFIKKRYFDKLKMIKKKYRF
ncbi:chorismate synthase [Candidatus Dependentiae bacterium]|nr:chorismate synthase [Candidatus Dependentiae bacterium]